ncbi:hypothetical protein C0Q98_31740 [Streptomyces albidoflavus]|nr:hypothetical protein C0Q98_31740 [Streptomyces albidoflavus]
MTDTLTHDQHTAPEGAVAPAAQSPALTAQGAAPTAQGAPESVPPPLRKGGRGVGPWGAGEGAVAPAAQPPAPTAQGAGVAAPETSAATPAGAVADAGAGSAVATASQSRMGGRLARAADRGTLWVTLVGLPLVGVIGFASSFKELKAFAGRAGFGGLDWTFPIGLDIGILVFLAADLALAKRGISATWLRVTAYLMTALTVVLNGTGADVILTVAGVRQALAADPLGALAHGVMPVLFVLGVDVARSVLRRAAGVKGHDAIPLHRWLLAPLATPRLYRAMRLAGITSYAEMLEQRHELEGYRVWLAQKHGTAKFRRLRKVASDEELLPFTMEREGYTVREALALPDLWAAQERQMQEEKGRRAEAERRAAEEAEAVAEAERAERDAATKIKKLRAEARVQAAEAQIGAETGTAVATAEAEAERARAAVELARGEAEQARTRAERLAAIDAQIEETEEQAARKAKAAAALERAAKEERRALAAKREAEAEEAKLRAERQAREEQEARAARAARQAEADRAEAQRLALEAAELARRVAVAEAAAQTAEEYAGLAPRARRERAVARMLLAAHPEYAGAATLTAEMIDERRVPLDTIAGRWGYSQTVAGEYRQKAKQLLVEGYRGAAEEGLPV